MLKCVIRESCLRREPTLQGAARILEASSPKLATALLLRDCGIERVIALLLQSMLWDRLFVLYISQERSGGPLAIENLLGNTYPVSPNISRPDWFHNLFRSIKNKSGSFWDAPKKVIWRQCHRLPAQWCWQYPYTVQASN
ncbi:c188620f-e384-4cd6-b08e-b8cb072652b5 [Sclerotinia trifoliorum]|uniref:C188620f-e384-4cd6-b08e-b8cb072652b5 n=1 Tax=Sclerotinia trifoliorum TaxID=28548 RepID=A0A8H2VYN1_9HELO|nr:c188620f-e384-4cd6-b08e-b8cb072652b5 [Sclerotinia trifoliorum]